MSIAQMDLKKLIKQRQASQNYESTSVGELNDINDNTAKSAEVGEKTAENTQKTAENTAILTEKMDLLKQAMEKRQDEAYLEDGLRFLSAFANFFKGDKGDKGIDGTNGKDAITPIKGKDYFTEQEVNEIVKKCTELAKPIKNVDYFDGKDGKDGEVPEEQVRIIFRKLETISKKIKDPETLDSIIQRIKTEKLLSASDLKDYNTLIYANKKKIDTSDQRWHGAGAQAKGTTAKWAFEDLTGLIDGANTHYTFTGNGVASSEMVSVNGQLKYETIDYTIDIVAGTLDYVTPLDQYLSGTPHKIKYQQL